MKISELIIKLQDIQSRRGDIEVKIYDEWDAFPIKCIDYNDGLERDGGRYEKECIVIESLQGTYGGPEA